MPPAATVTLVTEPLVTVTINVPAVPVALVPATAVDTPVKACPVAVILA